jgi:hypothetical protein
MGRDGQNEKGEARRVSRSGSRKKDEENKGRRNDVDLQPTFVEAVVVVRVVVVVAFVVAFVARDSPRSTPPLRLVPRVPPSPTAPTPPPSSSSSSHPAASYSESVFLRHPPGGVLPEYPLRPDQLGVHLRTLLRMRPPSHERPHPPSAFHHALELGSIRCLVR